MLYSIQRRTIMSKFRKFLGRITAETILKLDYFGSNPLSLKSPSGPRPLKTLFCRAEKLYFLQKFDQFHFVLNRGGGSTILTQHKAIKDSLRHAFLE